MHLPDDEVLPRDPKKLVREVDAAIRLSDIEKLQRYRDAVESKWWESGLVVLLFISGFAFIITIFKLIPGQNPALFWFVFGWFFLFVMAVVASIEFLLTKIRALRRLYEIQAATLEKLEKDLKSRPPESQQDQA
ncbi:MAG: hypothetical protein K1X53_00335 [Candidatus Sumerlaeaceae bacterium]|nr:hypothetical protein [Candidatus Sumerlaeaceae bacterium]